MCKNENAEIAEIDLTDPKYQNAKIYELSFPNTDITYIGSTIESLKTRLGKHRDKRNTYLRGNLYSNGDKPRYFSYYPLLNENNDMEIKLIHEYPCNNRFELENHEIDIQMTTPNICNKIGKKNHSELFKCECGTIIIKKDKNIGKHFQTVRHIKNIMKLNNT
tara:strand:- start:65 stop:553 length:489 start_codon:yes stop_codon:yes gene_type:complete